MGYTKQQAIDFINMIAPLMQAEAKKRGYKNVSCAIAQSVIEGAANTSTLAKKYHNHFGLKCGSAWLKAGKPSISLKTKEEYKVGTLTTINDYFRVYANDTEGVAGYYDFIAASRYANLKTATTYKQYAEMLKADGYATSSTYVNTLCKTVELYNLTVWDNFSNVVVKPTTTLSNDKIENIVVVETHLNIRNAPSTGSIVGKLVNGDRFSVLDYQKGWFKIGNNQWISEIYTRSRHGVVNVNTKLNIRSGNSILHKVLGKTSNNLKVKIVGESNGWYQIVTPDGLLGWADSRYINLI